MLRVRRRRTCGKAQIVNVPARVNGSPPSSKYDEPERRGSLLKRCRARISLERAALGPYLRLPGCIGKPVSQEEVAEAVGISRQWYSMLERDCPIRVSASVLARIADALMMDPDERAALFRLTVPGIPSISFAQRATVMLEAFASLRRLTRPLLAATTEAEALTLLREYAMTELGPDQMVTYARVAESRWDRAATGDPDADDRGKHLYALMRERWGDAIVDDLACYTIFTHPGELMTRSEIHACFPDIDAKARGPLAAVGWLDMEFAMASIRGQHGSVARILALHSTAHVFSEIERALLSTLADLASLALSG